jgi:hypothetical protein
VRWVFFGNRLGSRIDRKRKCKNAPYASTAGEIAAPVESDCGEPRPKRAPFIELLQRQKRRHEYVLHRVERVVGASEAGEGYAVQDIAVAANNLLESSIPPRETEGYEFAVGKAVEVNVHDGLR